MRIIAFGMTFWGSPEEAAARGEGMFGLKAWLERTRKYLNPIHTFMVSGTWSEPAWSPLGWEIPVINAGADGGTPYDVIWHNYSGCSYGAAFHYALNFKDWDLLAILDTDTLVGAVDFNGVLSEFMGRPETHLNEDYYGRPGGPFQVWKRSGASRWLNYRQRANFIPKPDGDPEKPMLLENEMGVIFKDLWWNPWPGIPNMRQDYGEPAQVDVNPEDTRTFPFIRKPVPEVIEKYLAEQTSQAKPVLV